MSTGSLHQKYVELQSRLKAPKGQFNAFGKYRYRSCEDILEAAKPICAELGLSIKCSDDVVEVASRIYVKATAEVSDGKDTRMSVGWAREEETKKGMDAAQVTGSCSSYARKYALNGLLSLDDTKDADHTNDHGKAAEPVRQVQKTNGKKKDEIDDKYVVEYTTAINAMTGVGAVRDRTKKVMKDRSEGKISNATCDRCVKLGTARAKVLTPADDAPAPDESEAQEVEA